LETPRLQGLALLILAAVTFFVYSQVGEHEFVAFDDRQYVLNEQVKAGLTSEGVRWAFETTYFSNWHPLTWLSYMLDSELYGTKPAGYHLTNVLLHIANTILLALALQRLTGAVWPSTFVAALFALHPLHVESVAWAAERKDVLSAFFWMLTLLAYASYARRSWSLWRYGLVVLCLSLGLLAKAMLVTLPFVLLLLDFWPLGRIRAQGHRGPIDRARLRSVVLEKLPLLVPVAVASYLTFVAQQQGGAFPEGLPVHLRIGNALLAYVSYLAKMIWPTGLTIFYPHPGATLALGVTVAAGLLLGAISLLVVRGASTQPYLMVGWLWYLGTLLPVIGLIQIGRQAMADRYTYLPLVGVFIMGAWGVPELLQRRRLARAWLTPGAIAVLGVLSVCTWLQIGYWKNSIRLFERAAHVTENNRLAHFNLGGALMEAGRDEAAIRHFHEALTIDPRFHPAHQNLEVVFARRGNQEQAARHRALALWIIVELGALYQPSVPSEPKVEPAPAPPADPISAFYRRGSDLALQGRIDEALPHFEEAVGRNPEFVDARLALGTALLILERRAEAIQHYLEALRIRPDDEGAHCRLAIALAQEGLEQEAAEHLAVVLHQNPGHPVARRVMRGIREQRLPDWLIPRETRSRGSSARTEHSRSDEEAG
jgi:tetratricopeptide (TPR) repeat protein